MKYHRLQIYTDNKIETYNQITKILRLEPTKFERKGRIAEEYGVWIHSVDVNDEEPYFDFINRFLDIVEPNLNELNKIGIELDAISIWLLYEYDQQCGMEFHPEEMRRLGESGIVLCIDCWQFENKI